MKWLLVIVSLCYTESQLIKDGKCPEMQAISSADLGKILGVWYINKFYDVKHDGPLFCSKHYGSWEDDNSIHGLTDAINRTTHEKYVMPFIITYKNQSGEYTENIFFNNVNESTNAQIIDIDYKSYQIIWSCIEKNDKSEIYLWILSRSKTLTNDAYNKIKDICKKHDIDPSILIDVDQEKC